MYGITISIESSCFIVNNVKFVKNKYTVNVSLHKKDNIK